MTKLLKLAIVGRPNVGKSLLFNKISKKRVSIVDEAEGITRDRLYREADFFGFPFILIDTGGIDPRSKQAFNEEVKRQAEIAIIEADAIVMVVDARIGVTALDVEIANILLKTKKPLVLAVNKIDDSNQQNLVHNFYSLGIQSIVPVSAMHGYQIAELLEVAFKSFEKKVPEKNVPEGTKICIVGRPNVGKSSLVNTLLNESRCIVSPIPGTTRDSIDVSFIYSKDEYTLIDTAGIRRKHSEKEVVDKFASIRTSDAIERSDLCLLMVDSMQGITREEKKIANHIEEMGKCCILLFNKWDLVKGFRMEHCLKSIEEEAPFLSHCPKIMISALTGRNIEKIFPLIQEVMHYKKTRISTPELNKFIGAALQRNHPPMLMGKRLRIYYMTQVELEPVTFVLFVNYPNLMLDTYKKYLYNQFRETYKFTGVPIVFRLKGRTKLAKNAKKDSTQEPEPIDTPVVETDFELDV